MLDIIKSYFSKEAYYVIITDSALYIKNYKKIINIEETEVLVELPNKIIKINGRDLTLNKIISKDLSVKGSIESVKYL